MSAPSKRVLLIAFHFPPLKGSSGLERVIGWCRHLPSLGWEPIVLSAHPRAYAAVSDERTRDISPQLVVERAFALDAARHLSLRGRYPEWLALPDRWASWLFGAVPAGWRLIRRHRPAVLCSTYPIATAHIIGCVLKRMTGVAWIADFRDPMVEYDARTGTHFPTDRRLRAVRSFVERLAARTADALVFCTPGAAAIFAERHPEVVPDRIHVIANGFDEESFSQTAGTSPNPNEDANGAGGPLTLLHSGVLYPGTDRDPGAFLQAVRALLDEQPHWADRLRIVLRASGFDDVYRPIVQRLRLEPWVELAPVRPYREALGEMLSADGLLVFQGHTSNPAIPAKLYEYFRARRPIFALVDGQGDTAALLRAERVGTLVPIDDPVRIRSGLSEFLADIEAGHGRVLPEGRVPAFDRRERTGEFARLLDRLGAGEVSRPGAVGPADQLPG